MLPIVEAKYQHIRSQAHRLGDQHYKTINEWLSCGAPVDSQHRCLEAAAAYKQSLDLLLTALADIPQTPEVMLAIESTLDFRSLIESELTRLNLAIRPITVS